MRTSPQDSGGSANRIAWRTALTYAVLGALWILWSDRALALLVQDLDLRLKLETAKGWAFVIVSASLLFAIIRRQLGKVERAEAARADAHRTYETVVQASPLAIIAIDEHDVVESWNPAAERMLGWKAEEVVGKPYPAVPESQKTVTKQAKQSILSGSPLLHVRVHRRTKDGRELEVVSSAAALPPREDGRRAMVAFLTDITEVERVRLAHERLTAICEATPDLIATGDSSGELIYLNRGGRDLLGDVIGDDLAGQSLLALVHPDDVERVERVAIPTALEHGSWRGEISLAGRLEPVPVHAVIVAHDVIGEIGTLISIIARDIRKERTVEDQLRQAQKMEAVGRLAGGVAHDFNNLLTIIESYAALLDAESALSAEAREAVRNIADAGSRAASLTKQLLAFSSRQALRPETLDLADVVRPTVAMLERLVGASIVIVHDLTPTPLPLRADRQELEQVLASLVLNARDAMPRGGTIRIHSAAVTLDDEGAHVAGVGSAGRYAVLTVQDTGRGMDKETRAQVFEPFFTTKEAGRGSGLSLASAYGTIRQSGGAIEVQSSPGAGTTFILHLPLVDEVLPTRVPKKPAELRHVVRRGIILVAEDDDRIRTLTERVLRRAGYEVIAGHNGEAVLELLTQRTSGAVPNLLLTDVVMPRMGGRQLARHVRELCPNIIVLYMSGFSQDESLRAEADEEGHGYLPKPFTPTSLLDAVSAALNN